MGYYFALNAFDAIIIIGVALPTLVMASKVKTKPLKILSVLLSSFLLVHGLYHLTGALSQMQGLSQLGFWSDIILEPFGWLLYLVFVVYFARKVG